MAHALAKDRVHRYATALDLGDAVRAALGLEPGPAWQAQRQFAEYAQTLSAPFPAVDPGVAEQAARLRTAMMSPFPSK
jgi:hypothetical protein